VRSPTGHRSSIPKATSTAQLPPAIRGLGNCLRIVPPNLWSVEGKTCSTLSLSDRSPQAGLILDSAHNLYGTTIAGGAYGYGVVFRLTPVKQNGNVGWKYVQLYTFTNGADGGGPASRSPSMPQEISTAPTAQIKQLRGLLWLLAGLQTLRRFERLWKIAALFPIPNQKEPGNVSLVLDSSGNIFGTGLRQPVL